MADFESCISDAERDGKIDADTAARTRETYRAARDQAGETEGPDGADRAGAKATIDALQREAIETERRQVLQARRRVAILEGFAEFKKGRGYTDVDAFGRGGGGGPVGPNGEWAQGGTPPEQGPFKKGAMAADALRYLISNRGGLSGGPFPSVEGRFHVVRGRFDAMMADVIEKFETHFGFDTPGRAVMDNVRREAFGEETGDQVSKALAKAWTDTAEMARQLFNEAGGAIPKLEGWGFPQTHDAARIYADGAEAWIANTKGELAAGRMLDRTSGVPMSDEALTAALTKTYENITSSGLVNSHPDQRLGMGALAGRRTDERFLVFKDSDAWQRYQDRYGHPDLFNTMMHHLDSMSKDIAAMQILGPNPAAQFDWLKRMAEIEAAQERVRLRVEPAVDKARGLLHHAQGMWDSYTGATGVPVNPQLAAVASGTRSYLIGAQLGSAILTDMPSAPFFGSIARTFAGVGAGGDFAQLGKLLADPEMRKIARRLEFVNDTARDGLISTTQDSLRMMTVGQKAQNGAGALARRLPAFTLRTSGLSGLFEARRRSFRLSFMGAIADAADQSLANLKTGGGEGQWLATELEARGFNEADWAKISAAEPWEPSPGAKFLRPSDIEKVAGFEIAARVGEMVSNLEQFAVPVSGSLWTRAAMSNLGKPGTVVGEGIRSGALYKTFLLNAHWLFGQEMGMRAMRAAPDWVPSGVAYNSGRIAWAASSAMALTMAGAVTLQVKALARGEDPISMASPKFWGAALLQGGSLGILGDFFYSAQSRTGHTAGVVGAGPLGDAMADAWDTGKDLAKWSDNPNGSQPAPGDKWLVGGEKAQSVMARQALTDLKKYTPLGSLWWARTVFQRAVLDQIQKAIDPDAQQGFDRARGRLSHDTGQDRWWQPGDLAPSRAPNWAAAWTPPTQH